MGRINFLPPDGSDAGKVSAFRAFAIARSIRSSESVVAWPLEVDHSRHDAYQIIHLCGSANTRVEALIDSASAWALSFVVSYGASDGVLAEETAIK